VKEAMCSVILGTWIKQSVLICKIASFHEAFTTASLDFGNCNVVS
jgi:hypothetical protein